MVGAPDTEPQAAEPDVGEVLSVSRLNDRIASVVGDAPALDGVRRIGEVTDLHQNSTALYFTLTDGDAELPCMIWANRYREMDADLEDGTEVILEGDINYWVEGGKIDLKPWEVIVVGDGDQAAAVERLRSELEERGWIVSDDGQYRSTQEGEAVLHSCARLRRYVTAVLERAPFFLRYGDRSVDLPLDGLENTHLAVSDAKSPQETLDALVELTSLNDVYRGDATLERIRAVCPIFSQGVFDIFEPLVDHGTEIEIIYDLESIKELTEKGNSHYLSVNVVAPNVTFRVYPEELTIGFGTYDDAAMLAGYTEEYPYDAGLTTDDQSIVDWTNAEFDRFLAESESPKPYVADAIEAYLPGVDFSTSLESDTQLSLPPMFGDQDPDDPSE